MPSVPLPNLACHFPLFVPASWLLRAFRGIDFRARARDSSPQSRWVPANFAFTSAQRTGLRIERNRAG